MARLSELFRRRSRAADRVHAEAEAVGMFLFDTVSEAIAAEKALAATGYDVKLVAPPLRFRAGCDLALELPRVEHVGATRELELGGVRTSGWIDDMDGECSVSDVVTTVDFGRWIMVRAGNMKITVEKASGLIVNTSGGGCPDIPYLNLELVGTRLADAPRPRDLGHTLCGLMLDRAFVEARRLLADSEPLAGSRDVAS